MASKISPIEKEIDISDIAVIGALAFAGYTLSKSGIFQGTNKIFQGVGDLTEAVTTKSGNLVVETGDLVSEYLAWAPLGSKYQEAVFNAGVWTAQNVITPVETWFKGLF